MSIPLPMKATSLSVKNTLHANEVWIETLSVKNRETKKFVDVFKYVNDKLDSVLDMEIKLKNMITEFNKAVEEIKTLKSLENPEAAVSSVPGPPGPAGPPGPMGPSGATGKMGTRGLRGLKGDSLTQISLASDVDVKKLKDGDVLVWSAATGKWSAQNIFDEE